MILETAILDVISGREKEFEDAFVKASPIIASRRDIFRINFKNVWKHLVATFYSYIGKHSKHIP